MSDEKILPCRKCGRIPRGRDATRAEMILQGIDPAAHEPGTFGIVLMAKRKDDGSYICIDCLEKEDPQEASAFRTLDLAKQIDAGFELARKEGRLGQHDPSDCV